MAALPTIGVLGAENSNGHALLEILAKAVTEADWVAYAPDPWAEAFNPPRAVKVAKLDQVHESDLLVMLAPGSEDIARSALAKGIRVLDCTGTIASAHPIVAEINGAQSKKHQLLGCPSAELVQAALVIAPLAAALPVSEVSVHALLPVVARDSTGPAVLAGEAAKLLNGQSVEPTLFDCQMAFNLLPQTAAVDASGFSSAERALTSLLPQLLELPKLRVDATCIQAPVFYALSESISLSLADELSGNQAKALLKQAPWLTVVSGEGKPNVVAHGVDSNQLSVGRVRQWGSKPCKIGCWSVMDYRYRGVAWNAVQIIQILIKSVL